MTRRQIANTPSFIKGVVNLRRIVPIVDLRIKLFWKQQYDEFTVVIILNLVRPSRWHCGRWRFRRDGFGYRTFAKCPDLVSNIDTHIIFGISLQKIACRF
jgi:hypothetical protein